MWMILDGSSTFYLEEASLLIINSLRQLRAAQQGARREHKELEVNQLKYNDGEKSG